MLTDPTGVSQRERHPNCQRHGRGSSYAHRAHPAHCRSGWLSLYGWASLGLRLACTLGGEEVDAP